MWTVNFQMFKVDLEKAEEPEIKLPTSIWSLKEQDSSRKTSISALLTMPKPLTVWIITNCGKFWKRWEYQTTWPALEKLYAGQEGTVRSGHGTTDWFHIGKGVRQGCILSPCLLNFYATTSYEILGWMSHKLESRLMGEIWTSDMEMIPLLWQKTKSNSRASAAAAAAAAKLLQLCLTLCDPIDGSPPSSTIPGIFQARVLEWGAIAFSDHFSRFQICVLEYDVSLSLSDSLHSV